MSLIPPYTIRLKIKDNTRNSRNDMFRGKIIVPTNCLIDPIISESNGVAIYNFVVVVDVNDMKIIHVIYGEEHISNKIISNLYSGSIMII